MKKNNLRPVTPCISNSRKEQGIKRIAVVNSEPLVQLTETTGQNQYHGQENYQLITEEESPFPLSPYACSRTTESKEIDSLNCGGDQLSSAKPPKVPLPTSKQSQSREIASEETNSKTYRYKYEDKDTNYTRLPEGFKWTTFDLTVDSHMEELKEFLSKNYPESDVEQLNYEYTTDYVKWKIAPPHYHPNWHFGIRETRSGKLVGVICAIPMNLFVEYCEISVTQVMFVCVNKTFRTIGLTPLLYSELLRRTFEDSKISQLFFTTQKTCARDCDPSAKTRIWAKDLATSISRKRIAKGSNKSHVNQRDETDKTGIDGELINELQKLTLEKAAEARRFLVQYLTGFRLQPIYSEKEFIHWFLSKPVETYVVVGKFGDITDFVSFFIEEVRVLKGTPVKKITCAHSVYTIATSMPTQNLMQDALKIAKKKGIDLFLATEIMNNKEFIHGLNFQELGTLNYYLHGIKCSKISSSDIAFVNN